MDQLDASFARATLWALAVGISGTLLAVEVTGQNFGPAAKIVPCTPQQAQEAQVRGGGAQSFGLPNGQTVQVNAPNGWCVK